jgi:stage II sporulation protein D
MNEMYETGYFTEKQIQPLGKQATAAFTFGKLEQLYDNMGITDKELLSYVKNNKSAKVVTNSLWAEILDLLSEKVESEGIEEEEFNVVATASNVSSLDAWTVVTTIGDYKFTGLAMDYYIDKRVKVLTKDDQILCVTELLSDSVLYPNSLATSIENGEIHAFINGVVRTFQIEDNDVSSTNAVVDIRVKKGKVSDYQVKQNYVSGKLLKYTDSTVEIEGLGSFTIGEGFRVYKTYGNIESKTLYDMVVGYDVQKFVIEDDKVCAVLIDRNFVAQNIRVVIKTNGFSDIYHDSLLVSSESEYQFSYGNETKKFSAGEEYTITPDSPYLSEGTLKISVSALDGRITLKSLQRGYGEPSYRGTIEVTKTEEGLLVINELPLEEYLYAVVPSEMPYTYSQEALKAQAVCARSYAYRQMLGNAYANLGAHVDDSTAFQVYNNSEEQVTTNQAVDETYGQVMLYDNEPISAFFYSTSCGYGTDADIWGGEGYPYIRGRLLSTDNASFDLTDETQFRMFITSTYDTYDKNYGWYRWNVTLPLSSITQSVNAQIASLYAASPEKVLTLEGSTYVSKEISTVGNVQSVETGTRGNGGVLHSIIIHGDQATVMIQTESYIRRILNPSGCILQKLDGTTTDTMTTLPSAFFVIDEVREGDTLTGYKFQGGGYGHGAGMSQNGANSMGDAGMGYEEILNFFYNDITIQQMY